MKLNDSLIKKKSAILKKWFKTVAETYPPDTAAFLQRQSDPFSNPVGSATLNGLTEIFDQLVKGVDANRVSNAIDPIIRIRAVQDFTPSKAVGFVFKLKGIIRDEIDREAKTRVDDLMRLDAEIDGIALIAFDIYMKCRETIFQLKANEVKKTTFRAFKRAGLIVEEPGDSPESA